jgi:hypothetical protein
MKSRRRSVAHSARASHRRFARTGGRTLVEFKCPAGAPFMDTVTDQQLESGKAANFVLHPVERTGEKAASKRSSSRLDPEMLLHLSQQLYAHALTLQEVIRNEGEVAYDVLRPRCDRQAAKQFEIFYRAGDEPTTEADFEPMAAADCSS